MLSQTEEPSSAPAPSAEAEAAPTAEDSSPQAGEAKTNGEATQVLFPHTKNFMDFVNSKTFAGGRG